MTTDYRQSTAGAGSPHVSTAASLPRLMIVGPLPPPFIGPAVATERLIASPILREAFDVALLDTSDPGGEEDIGRFTMRNVREALRQMRAFWSAMLKVRPSVLYISIARGFWGFLRDALIIIPARLFGARVVIHLRAGRFDLLYDNGILGRLLARVGLGAVTYAAVLGQVTRRIFENYVAPERVKVVPNGIDLSAWLVPERAPGTDEGFHILYLANLFHDKGAHVMINAIRFITREIPDLKVTFAGEWFDDAYRDLCMGFIRDQELEKYVEFVGVVKGEEKKKLIASADLVAFTPVAPEGSPWVVLEAMASARAVIGTPMGTMKEVIVQGETGFLVEPGNPQNIARRTLELMRDRDLLRRMGENGRRRVEEVYSEPKTHRILVEVLKEAMGGQSPESGVGSSEFGGRG